MQQLTLFTAMRAFEACQLCRYISGAATYKARWYVETRVRSYWQQQFVELAAEASRIEILCDDSMPQRAGDGSNLKERWAAKLPDELSDAVQELEGQFDFISCESGRWRMELIPNNEAAWKSKTAPLWREPQNPSPLCN